MFWVELILVKLIVAKNELKIKWIVFGYISYKKVSWTIEVKPNIHYLRHIQKLVIPRNIKSKILQKILLL